LRKAVIVTDPNDDLGCVWVWTKKKKKKSSWSTPPTSLIVTSGIQKATERRNKTKEILNSAQEG